MQQNEQERQRNDVRAADPDGAAQDPENAAIQRQVERNRDALEEQHDRTEATAPRQSKDRTIGEMADDAERESGVDLQRSPGS